MADPNRELLESAVRLLHPLLDELVFIGGCTTGLLLTDAAAGGIRPTKDVDAIVDVPSYAKYAALSERLRALGLTEDTTEGAPLCRWRYKDLIVDVMPIDEDVLGFSNKWYPPAIESAELRSIAASEIRVVTPVYFVATKLEAFHGRGANDVAMSHDVEDIVTVVDGRPEIVGEIASAASEVRELLRLKSAHCSTTRTSSTPCRVFSCPTPPASHDDRAWRTDFGRSRHCHETSVRP